MEHKLVLRRVVVLAMVVSVSFGLVSSAGAAPDHKTFQTSVTPNTVTAGTAVGFDLTITNTSTNSSLGAARITLPSDYGTPTNVALSASGWTSTVASTTIEVAASANEFKLPPGTSIVVSFDTVTPLKTTAGDRTDTFVVEARQANDFNGRQNDLRGQGPTVTITGVAVDCHPGDPCNASLPEAGTVALASTTCPSDSGAECGNLILDLDENCLGQACVGRAAFWVPPTVDSGTVDLVLQIPKNQFDGGPGSVVFYIAGTSDGTAFECGKHPEIECTYRVSGSRSFIEVSATIERVDPRGFVS